MFARILSWVRDVLEADDRNRSQWRMLMKLTVVRYKTKPEKAEENARLIQTGVSGVAGEIARGCPVSGPEACDGTFVHFSIAETKDGASPIPRLEAFRSFQAASKSGASSRRNKPRRPSSATTGWLARRESMRARS